MRAPVEFHVGHLRRPRGAPWPHHRASRFWLFHASLRCSLRSSPAILGYIRLVADTTTVVVRVEGVARFKRCFILDVRQHRSFFCGAAAVWRASHDIGSGIPRIGVNPELRWFPELAEPSTKE